MIPDKIQNDFYSGVRSELIKYCINDSVQVLNGKNKGLKCAVISVEQIEPEVVYLVESGKDGSMFTEVQTNLDSIE